MLSDAPKIMVGTASWTDPTLVNSDLFYPSSLRTAEERLIFYAAHFPTVEVDASYYTLLSERVAELWAQRTPPGFVFNVKAFAWLTQHPADVRRLPVLIKQMLPPQLKSAQRIKNPPSEVLNIAFQMFWSSLEPLRKANKLGRILFQMPPYVTCKPSNMNYLASLPLRMQDAAIAVEFRHPSWTSDVRRRAETLRFLREHDLAYVSIDAPPRTGLPLFIATTADDAYIRFHGRNDASWFKRGVSPAERFKYLYSERELAEWAGRLQQLSGVRRAFAIFNNCYSNFGIMNATTMREMLTR